MIFKFVCNCKNVIYRFICELDGEIAMKKHLWWLMYQKWNLAVGWNKELLGPFFGKKKRKVILKSLANTNNLLSLVSMQDHSSTTTSQNEQRKNSGLTKDKHAISKFNPNELWWRRRGLDVQTKAKRRRSQATPPTSTAQKLNSMWDRKSTRLNSSH